MSATSPLKKPAARAWDKVYRLLQKAKEEAQAAREMAPAWDGPAHHVIHELFGALGPAGRMAWRIENFASPEHEEAVMQQRHLQELAAGGDLAAAKTLEGRTLVRDPLDPIPSRKP